MKMINDEARRKEMYRRLREEELQSHQNAQGGAPLIWCNTDHIQAADDLAGRAFSSLRPFADEENRMTEEYFQVLRPICVEFVQKQVLSSSLARFGLTPELDAIQAAARAIDDPLKINQFIALRPGMGEGQFHFDQQQLVGEILFSALSNSPAIKDDWRVRKQRCGRRFQAISQMIEDKRYGSRFFGLVRMGFHLNPLRQNKDDIHALASFRSLFFKDWKRRGDFEGVVGYFWFLGPDWSNGAKLNVYLIVDIEVNPNLSALVSRLGDYWVNTVTKGHGLFTQNAYFVNQMGICPNGACIVDTTDASAMNRVMSDLIFECDRELYIRFKRADVKECFGHGSVGMGHWAKLRQLEKRNASHVPVSGSALMSSFLSSIESAEALDSLGIYLGFDFATSSSIFHRPAALQNGHCIMLGPSGSGKTTGLYLHCLGLLRAGVPVVVLDPHNQMLGRLPMDTQIVSNGEGAFGVNPLQLYFAEWKKRGLDGQIEDKIDLIDQGAGNGLGHRERDVLKMALREIYARSGLKDEPPTESWICPTMDHLADVLEEYLENSDWKDQKRSIAGALAAARAGFGNRVFNQAALVHVSEYIKGRGSRLDLSGLDGAELGMVMNTILRDVWQTCRDMGPLPPSAKADTERFRLFVIIDEAHLLNIGWKLNAKARILDTLMREGRKFGICVVIATQGVNDLSDTVRKNAAAWMSFRQVDEVEARVISRKFGVSLDALRSLKNVREAYFWDGRRPTASRIELPDQDEEHPCGDSWTALSTISSYYEPDDISA